MELLYIWIEKYKAIKEEGFDISNEYKVEFNKDKKLLDIRKIEDSELRRMFYGSTVKNITALVGKNGSGKTTLIDFLTSHDNKKGFLIFKDKDKFLYKDFYDDRFNLKGTENINLEKIENEKYKENILYYDNMIISYTPYKEGVINISTSGLLNEHLNNTVPLISNDIKNTLLFLDSQFTFPLLKKTNLFKENKSSNFMDNNNLLKMKNLELKVSLINDSNESYSYSTNLKKDFLNFFIYNTLNKIHGNDKGIYIYPEITNLDKKKIIDLIGDTSYSAQKINNKQFEDFKEYVKEKPDDHILKYFINIFEKIEKLLQKFKVEKDGETLLFTVHKSESEFLDFLDFTKKNRLGYHFFEYSWRGLSSGQVNFLNLFSRIYSKIDEIEKLKNQDTIIFVLDEPEIYLHPEWSRQFINLFIDFLDELFKVNNINKKIQIILSSHSPYLVSDIPNSSIILFKKDNKEANRIIIENGSKEKTLGANIHSLYKNSFFLDSTMGEFARIKINNTIDEILEVEKDPQKYNKNIEKKIDYIINQIGEDILRNKIKEKWEEVKNRDINYKLDIDSYNVLSSEHKEKVDKLIRELGANQ